MDEGKYAKQRLTDACKTKDIARRLTLVFATVAAAMGVLLLIALADYWFILPATVRVGGVLLLALIVGAGAFRLTATLRHPTDLKEAALDAEAQKAGAGCELSTAAEYLGGARKPAQEYEAELAAALEAKAADQLKSLQVPYWNRSVPAAIFLGACAVAVLLFGVVVSGGFTAFKRAAAPWSDTPYTRVEVKPGNVEIPVGKDLDIKSVFSGRIPKSAQISWQDEGSAKWQFASLTRNQQGEYIYPLKNVQTPVSYRVSGSDAVSPAFRVEPYTPPEVKEWRIDLDLPDYTRKPPITQNAPQISVLRGSTAHVRIAPNVKLARARLQFENGPTLDFQPRQNGFWTTDLPISKDARFWVELADEKGHTGRNETPYQITALRDESPKVEIPDPGQDLRAEATNSVPVKISVTDDYGLREIKLVYHKLGGPEQFITASRNGETNSEFTAEIPLSSLGLQQFELVAFHAEATDNNTLDGPGVGKSDVYFIEITDQEGGKCKSQGKSQRVNLLVIQKQIVADTTALAANAAPDKFEELAKRQKDAVDFGNMYVQGLAARGTGEALAEMQAAVADMEKAQSALEKQQRAQALPPSESALGHLYQVVKLMPELKDLPTRPQRMPPSTNRPPVLNVVLDTMKKNKKEDPNEQELSDALEQAERLRDEQASVNIGVQSSGSGSSQGNSEAQLVRASSESKAKAGKAQSKGNKGKGKAGKNKGQPNKADAQQGEGKQGKPADKPADPQDNADPKDSEPQDAQALAQKETELSKEAVELAQKLQRLAGKGSRLGHNAGSRMNQAAQQMNAAAQAMAAGNMQSAGTKGAESGAALNEVVAAIERALKNRPERVDVSQEESPKEYETLVAEYLKKLSHEE